MRRFTTTIFAAMIVMALSVPGWAQSTATQTKPAVSTSKTEKKQAKAKAKAEKKAAKKSAAKTNTANKK
jgi:hypothetical protein